MAEIVLHRRALRYLQRLSRPDQDRVRSSLARLAADIAGYPGVIQMAGEWVGYQRILGPGCSEFMGSES